MYESENQALSTHPDFFDPIHKSAEVVMIAGDENEYLAQFLGLFIYGTVNFITNRKLTFR